MKKILLPLFLLVFYFGNTQTLHYGITSKGHSIGNLTTTKTVDGNTMQIDVVSEVNVRILVKIDFKYMLHCTYRDNELSFSSVTTYVNGKVHSTSTAEKTGDHYTLTKDGHVSKFLNKITFSNGLLYHKAPINQPILFSESNVLQKQVEQTGGNTFDVTNPSNKHVSQYTYANGVLEKATVHNKLMTFVLTKQ